MTADRTQHVLDAIDGCLEDWTVSGDAMRWSPEPEATDRARRGWTPDVVIFDEAFAWPLEAPLVVTDAVSTRGEDGEWTITGTVPRHEGSRAVLTGLIDEAPEPLFPARRISAAVDAYGSAIRAACDADAERLHRMLNPTPEALDMRAQILRAFDLTPAEAGFEPDPRAHALHLRRTRNTGPERKPAGRQKRPREL